jgi:hypothetical protein
MDPIRSDTTYDLAYEIVKLYGNSLRAEAAEERHARAARSAAGIATGAAPRSTRPTSFLAKLLRRLAGSSASA